jgi:DNA replication and repair protein RecF
MITDIHLENFRSYRNETFEFSPGINIIVGPNASGKTNLLEAILFVSGGDTYRTRNINEIINTNADTARLEAHGAKNEIRIAYLQRQTDYASKQFKINDQNYKRLSFLKRLPVVVFEPNNVLIITGPPELRRNYLDDLLEQLKPGYASLRRQYKRALTQRNNLLRQNALLANKQLFVWNVRLSELGEQIALQRHELVETMNKLAEGVYQQLTKSKLPLELGYASSIPIKQYGSKLLHQLEVNVEHDMERGFTSHGPHRDDLKIILNKFDVTFKASRGEIRSLTLVLAIIQTKLLEETRAKKPILLLDDVFSELDGARRRALTKFLKSYQAFITTTDADIVIKHFTQSANIIPTQSNNKK